MGFVFASLLLLTSIFLILLVLIQRGRGGGLTGALGGMGGQSAFGTKAGDLFTRITIGVAFFWIVLSAFAVKYYAGAEASFDAGLGGASKAADSTTIDPFATSKGAGTSAPITVTTKGGSEAGGAAAGSAPTASSSAAPSGGEAPSSGASSTPASGSSSETPATTP